MARSYPCPHCGASLLPSDASAGEHVTCPHCHAEVPNPARQVTVARIQTRSRPPAPTKHVGEHFPAEDDTLPPVAVSAWKMRLIVAIFLCGLPLIASICAGYYAVLFGYRVEPILGVGFALVVFLVVWLVALWATRSKTKAITANTVTHQDIWILGIVYLIMVPVVVAVGIVLFATCTGGRGC